MTPAPGFDLQRYAIDHRNDALILFGIAVLVNLGHWRNWLWPDDLRQADGTQDPRAGRLNLSKVVADFLFVPTIVISALICMGWSANNIAACVMVVVLGFVGSGFIMATFEKARDGMLGVGIQFLTRWFGGGK